MIAVPRRTMPCSQAQQRFWFEEGLHPKNPALNVAVRWQLDGDLDDGVFAEAWRRLVARHDMLRTSLVAEDGDVVQVVEAELPFEVDTIDLRALPEGDRAREADRLAAEAARRPFDLTIAPLVRVGRLHLSDTRSIVLVTAHHTVCDGWSIGILARETGAICAALQAGREPELPDLPLGYGDYAAHESQWLATSPLAEETAYSRRSLEGYVQFELPTDRPRPAIQSSNGAIASTLLERSLTSELAALASAHDCTLFMVAYAALLVLLHRYGGETDIAIGTQVVCRDEPELEDLVGCFINTIVLRSDLSGDPSFLTLLDRARGDVSDAFEIRHFPLERLIEVANPKRDLSRNSLFSVNFIFQRSFIKNATYERFSLADLPSRSAGALYDLNFFMVERPDGWRASCEYNADLFDESTVTSLLGAFETLLRSVVRDPGRPIGALPILAGATRQELLTARNATEAEYPAGRTLPDLFAERAAATPDAIAVVCGERALTYAELDRASSAVAGELRRRGCAPGGRVGVLLHRSTGLPVALLGVMKSGSAYVPLDPAYPPARLAAIAEDARLTGLVTSLGLEERLPVSGAPVVLIDSLGTDPEAAGDGATPRPDDAAYVIYTSGSTGRPKGVAVSHRALVNFLWSMRTAPGLSARDTLVAVTTVSFDIAALELYLPLLVGAALVIAPADDLADGPSLLRLLRRHRATVVQATPVTWQLLIDAGWNGTPHLRVLCGGEALSRTLADGLLARSSEVWNLYGPTETTVWSAAARVAKGTGPVTIGPPIANTQFYVLDDRLAPLPLGARGELFIGGDGVAIGYFDAETATAERFLPDPFSSRPNARLYRTGDVVRARADGHLDFLGRADGQIKLRGFRIELAEIEAALCRQADVTAAACITAADASGDVQIVAYATPARPLAASASEAWSDDLRERLALLLPRYMIPASVVALGELPRTPNGKLDRRALPSRGLVCAVPDPDAKALTPAEAALTSILAELLQRTRLRPGDDIFALGFHSLLAVRLVARIHERFGVTLPLQALFSHPNVRGLASQVELLRAGDPDETAPAPIVTLNPDGTRTPFVYLHSDLFSQGLYCRRLAAALGPSQPIHAVAPHGTAGLPELTTIEAMALDYVDRIRAVQPAGPYRLGGFCVSGLVAYEIARALRAAGDTVEDVVMINSSALPTRSLPFFDRAVRTIGVDRRLSLRLRERLTYTLARAHAALARGPRATTALIGWQLRTLLSRRRRARGTIVVDPEPFVRRRGARETENAFKHIAAALSYHPRPYGGDVTLVWSDDQLAFTTEPTVGWNRLARTVRVVPIAGGHVTVLHSGVADFAKVLERVLA